MKELKQRYVWLLCAAFVAAMSMAGCSSSGGEEDTGPVSTTKNTRANAPEKRPSLSGQNP